MKHFDQAENDRQMDKLLKEINEPPTDLHLRVLDALILILGVLCFLALISWAQYRDIEDAVEMHKEEASRVTGMLADCMNGKGILDRKTNVGYFCGKAIPVQL